MRRWCLAQGHWGVDRGSGSILAVALIAAMLAFAALLVPLSLVIAAKHQAAGAADSAALAAAEVAVGIHSGLPCEAASSSARSNGGLLGKCRTDGAVVTVQVLVPVLQFTATATATAGPPGSGVK